MAHQGARPNQRRPRQRQGQPQEGTADDTYDISISAFGPSHRAAVLNEAQSLVASAHLRMAREWPITCSHLKEGLRRMGLLNITDLLYIRLDNYLINAMVERWCPSTNTFHLPTGEMTITLQDVQVILGIRIDGDPIVGPTTIGEGNQWESWFDCCDDLLGSHPDPEVSYHDPDDHEIESTFTAGTGSLNAMMPLRWLRWAFYRDSYRDLPAHIYQRHLRAYCLYMIGCFLLPDTSGSHVPMQYLALMTNLGTFSRLSIGSAVLAHLYRELRNATSPGRTYIAGCLPLLQVWCWERLSVGRPTLRVPRDRDIYGKALGCRWVENRVRDTPNGNTLSYRVDLDRLQQQHVTMLPYSDDVIAQLHPICRESSHLGTARVPIISWKRAEWHLPDRVMRQFGGVQFTTVLPVDKKFKRVDGRGRAGVDWTHHYAPLIALWNNRNDHIAPVIPPEDNGAEELSTYLTWYRSWASIYLVEPPIQPQEPEHEMARANTRLREYFRESVNIAEQFSQAEFHSVSSCRVGYDQIRELANRFGDSISLGPEPLSQPSNRSRHRGHDQPEPSRRSMSDASRRSDYIHLHSPAYDPPRQSMYASYGGDAGPPAFDMGEPSVLWGSQTEAGPSTYGVIPEWMAPFGIPSSTVEQDILFHQPTPVVEPEHHMEEESIDPGEQREQRQRRPPDRYTPGSGAIPRRRRTGWGHR